MTRILRLPGITTGFALLLNFNLLAQGWVSIPTPVTTNLILYEMSFPAGQNDIGYTGGASLTYNGKGKILKTTDQGLTWDVIWESDVSGSGVSAIFFRTPTHGFAGTQAGNLMTTTDGGQNWNSFDIDPGADQGSIIDIEFIDAVHGVLSSQYEGIYYTFDGGATWTPASPFFIAQDIAYANTLTLFAVGNGQKTYKSVDGGVSWTLNFDGPGVTTISLGVHFSDINNGLVTSEEGAVFVTHNSGASWDNYTVPDQYGHMRGAWVIDEENMYTAGTPGQVYKTIDGGVNWTADSPFDPNPSYYKILFTENGTGFVCGSGSSGGTILRKLPATALSFNVDETTNVSCHGGTDGAIQITVTGGALPYTFSWSNGSDLEDQTGLPAGEYTCTIIDGEGSTQMVGPITISEPPALDPASSVVDESVDGANDGSIDLTVTGGTPPYTFFWSNGATTEDLENLPDGTYCVTITDSNDCVQEYCATVKAGPPNSAGEIHGLTGLVVAPNPLGEEDLLVVLQFSEVKTIVLRLVDALGREVYHSSPENTDHVQTRIGIPGLPAGVYFLRVHSVGDQQQIVERIVKQ